MKKKILTITLLTVLTFCFTGCTVETETNTETKILPMFIKVESGESWNIVYQKDTKVMYAISNGFYNCGTFTLLVNEDGTPMLYSE